MSEWIQITGIAIIVFIFLLCYGYSLKEHKDNELFATMLVTVMVIAQMVF